MAQITYYAPAGVTSINLSDGSRAVVVNGQITADSKFRNELEAAGCSANAETDNAVRITKTVTGGVEITVAGLPVDVCAPLRDVVRSPSISGSRITLSDGRLQIGGADYRGVFVNAHDQFIEMLAGNNYYVTDLPAIASHGVRLVRVSMGPIVAADWTSKIGTVGTAPVASFLTNVRTFLDAAQASGIGVVLTMFWSAANIPIALGSTQADYLSAGSTTRVYMASLAELVARTFKNHPALAAYSIGNEWFDLASVAKFASPTSDTTKDHFGALVATINDIVNGIRKWDNDRVIISPHGSGGRYESGNVPLYVRKFVSSVGNCDVADFHLYPDTDRVGFAHIGTGSSTDMGSSTALLSMIRSSLLKIGKTLIVMECGADDDHPTYNGTASVGNLSKLSWKKCHDAGVELVGDWGWYGNATTYATSPANLKVLRNAVMPMIAKYNAGMSYGYVAPPIVYQALGDFIAPKTCARGTGTANSFVRIPAHPDLSIDPVQTSRIWMMFWLKKRSVLSTSPRIFANNDVSNNGIFFTSSASEGVVASIGFGTGYSNVTGNGNFYNFPADMPTDPTVMYPGEWHHVAVYWDGVVNAAPGGDGSQHASLFIDGMCVQRLPLSGKSPSAISTRDLLLLSSSDGLSNFAEADMCDFITAKNQILTTQHLFDYLQKGDIPPGAQHRWKLDGNAQDSIGTLHGVAGAALQWVSSGL